ncbi:hypothetical protein D6829_00775 [Candidatus Pacearchaeota archaeon]|nr:MAG: hypothetical protein D6829_00775 [Candidatus Pacearchaeota archaeon]
MERKISKSRIEKRLKTKKDPLLVETIIKLKKTNPEVAKELAKPKRRWPSINLRDIDAVKGDVIIAGKILSSGEIHKTKKVVAWSASKKALEKMKKAKVSFVKITEELKKNPKLNNLTLVKDGKA